MAENEEKKESKKVKVPPAPGLLDVMMDELKRRFKPGKAGKQAEEYADIKE